MPVNILYIIDSLAHGGTEKQLVQLIRNLDPDRFRPHLCTLKASAGLYQELDIPKITLDFVGFGHPSLLRHLTSLSSFIRRHRIRLVQTFFQDPFLLAAMVKPFNRIKLIGSFRDLGFWRTPAETRKMRIAYPFFSGFIANSHAVKDHFVQVDGIRPGKFEVIYNGIDLESVRPRDPQEFGKEPPVVGIVANLNRPVKRVQDFIQAAAMVHRACPTARFVVVGDGHLRGLLEELGEALGLRECLTFTGRLENPLEVVRSFHVGVISSETEGFCNAIVEYMACGIPVVATAVGGNLELVADGENGFLVPPESPQKLAKEIIQLVNDRRRCREIGEKNINKIQRHYSIATMVANQSEYYDSLVVRC
jgi:glycosyltransferase involved in cell wall biosynthesis